MSINFTEIRARVHVEVPGCPLVLMDQKILDAAREFFRRTYIWRKELSAINIVAATTSYALTAPSGAQIVDVTKVEIQDRQLTRGFDFTMSLDADATVVLEDSPTANITGGLVVEVALMPALGTTSMEDRFYNMWPEAFAHGAKYYLMTIPGKPWSNPEAAAYYRGEFLKFIERARIRENFNKAAGGLQVKIPSIL